MLEFKYRPDIDGLRAIAVLLVLFFHAGFGFAGGFVGVDVFFVISGFLITGLILKEERAGTFRLREFLLRRVRRILPAASLMALVTLLVGGVLLLPNDFSQLAKSTIAQQSMLANVFFWRNTGYFAPTADLQPLLHTWSLAVEEQFYLGYPLLLMCTGKMTGKTRFVILLSLTVISFAICVWGVYRYPTATFYLLPTRAWELLLGGLLVFAPQATPRTWQQNAMGWLGLLAILLPAVCYTAATPFPGFAAMLPCVGTMLVIYSGTRWAEARQTAIDHAPENEAQTSLSNLLSNPTLVFVGLLSYSLYLWHWPVLAFARRAYGLELPTTVAMLAIAVSFGLAYLSWRFVETPLRKASTWRFAHTPFYAAAGATCLLIAISIGVLTGAGLPGRIASGFPAMENAADGRLARHRSETPDVVAASLPLLGHPEDANRPVDFVVWGDSHALALADLCDAMSKEHHLHGRVAAREVAIPLLDVWKAGMTSTDLVAWNTAVLEFVESSKCRDVILVARWSVYVAGDPQAGNENLISDDFGVGTNAKTASQVLRRGLTRTVQALQTRGVRVWIVGQIPEYETAPLPQTVMETWSPPADWLSHRRKTLETHLHRQAEVQRAFEAVVNSDTRELHLLDPTPYCFDSEGASKILDADGVYYRDDDHLSQHGARVLLTPLLEPAFREINQRSEVAKGGSTQQFIR